MGNLSPKYAKWGLCLKRQYCPVPLRVYTQQGCCLFRHWPRACQQKPLGHDPPPQVSLVRCPTPSQNPRLAGAWLGRQLARDASKREPPNSQGHPGAWPQKPGPANSISMPGATHHAWSSARWGCARRP